MPREVNSVVNGPVGFNESGGKTSQEYMLISFWWSI